MVQKPQPTKPEDLESDDDEEIMKFDEQGFKISENNTSKNMGKFSKQDELELKKIVSKIGKSRPAADEDPWSRPGKRQASQPPSGRSVKSRVQERDYEYEYMLNYMKKAAQGQ